MICQVRLVRSTRQGRLASRFFLAALAVFGIAGSGIWLLVHLIPYRLPRADVALPDAFLISTLLLFVGSGLLHRAVGQVRIERQRPFRRSLIGALLTGTLFVTVQGFGLWCLLQQQRPAEVSTGVGAFVFVFSLLHGAHFSVALLFVVFVAVQAIADRYDHEYYWGVAVCAFFWHMLAVVWLIILAVFAVAA